MFQYEPASQFRCRNPQRSTSRADDRIGHWRGFAMLPQRRLRLARLSQPYRLSRTNSIDPDRPEGQSTMDALTCRRYRSSRRLVAMNLRPIMADWGWLDYLRSRAMVLAMRSINACVRFPNHRCRKDA
jgi:hypothetical protein